MEGAGKDPKPRAYSPDKHDAGYERIDWSARCKQCGKRVEWKEGRHVCECMREIHNDTRLGQ
jgi:hypothetical protein